MDITSFRDIDSLRPSADVSGTGVVNTPREIELAAGVDELSRTNERPRNGKVWKIRDLGSSNGTFLEEKKVSKSDLPSSCQLRFHEAGPTVEMSIHNMEKTAVTRDAGAQAGSQ